MIWGSLIAEQLCMAGAQVTAAAEGYQAAIAEKDAHIATLAQDAEDTRIAMQADIDRLRTDMEVGFPQEGAGVAVKATLSELCIEATPACKSSMHACHAEHPHHIPALIITVQRFQTSLLAWPRYSLILRFTAAAMKLGARSRCLVVTLQAEVSAMKEAMQDRLEEAVAETQNKASGMRDARERNVHFSARVVALNSRIGALQRQVSRHFYKGWSHCVCCQTE